MIKGSVLRDAVISAAITINNRKREVDELNVYPVPDGDTGTNMSMTIGNSVAELKRLNNQTTAAEVASTAASAFPLANSCWTGSTGSPLSGFPADISDVAGVGISLPALTSCNEGNASPVAFATGRGEGWASSLGSVSYTHLTLPTT